MPNVNLTEPAGAHLKGGGGVSALQPPARFRNLRNEDAVDIAISNVIRDLPYS